MADYSVFRQNILDKIERNTPQDVLRIKADSLDEIFSVAEEHFNISSKHLSFEIESVHEKSLLRGNNNYVVLAYPTLQDYDFAEEPLLKVINKDGEAFLRFGKGDIYLSVTAPVESGVPVSFSTVKDLLEKRPLVEKYDINHIKSIVNKAQGIWVNIGRFEHYEEYDARYTVRINQNKMAAFLQIYRPQLYGADVSFVDLQRALYDAGVSYGIDEDLLYKLEYKPVYNQLIEVAVGTPVEHGQDAKIEICAKRSNIVDVNSIITVQKGEIVAIKKPFTYGNEGRSVDGDVIYPSPGSDVNMLGNKNVKINDENTEAVALENGSVVLEKNTVSITDVLVIDGDITPEVGNINFPGSVIVKGSIPDDYTLNIDGDLQVNGGIANVIIKVKGNLRVVGGINGRGHAHIEVGKSLYTHFIENTEVITTGGDCIVDEGIINSTVESLGRVIALSGKGRVISSTIKASLGIYIQSVGSNLGGNSLLCVISLPKERKNLESVLQLRAEHQKELKHIKSFLGENIKSFNQKNMDKAQKAVFQEKLKTLQRLQTDSQRLVHLTESIRKKLTTVKSTSNIMVEKKIKTGTSIVIDDAKMDIQSDIQSTVFYLSNNKINSRVFSEKTDSLDVMNIIEHVF